jgi:MoaA/NifB/PqqE/SkfB family radical SAM enzyme
MVRPSTKEVLDWMDEAATLGCQSIQVTGGECTLRDDLQDLLDYARPRFKSVEVFTNATLLTPALIRFLAENKIRVAFSFYSYKPEVHDRITRVPGSYQKTLGNLKLLLAHEVTVRGGIIGMKQNEADLDATEYFLRSLGVAVSPNTQNRPGPNT